MSRYLEVPITNKARVLVFAGSLRNGSLNRKLAAAADLELQHAGLDSTLLDLREYPMPFYDADLESAGGLPEVARQLRDIVRAHDALVIASPEYNGSFPAVLKNVIDWISRPHSGEKPLAVFQGKIAGLLSASPGSGGGRRGLRHLRELLQNIGVSVMLSEVSIPGAADAFHDDELFREPERSALAKFIADLKGQLQSRERAA
jgi:chromate reductase, NAD(P)H dehydrogenase (quinone)